MADPKAELSPVTVGFIDTGPTLSQRVPVTAANPLPVTIAAAGPDVDVNLAAVNGQTTTAFNTGVVGTGTQRVTLATDVNAPVYVAPTAVAGAGITPVVSTALETGHVIKAGAGNLYGFCVVSTTAAGYVQVFNSTTVPAAGAVTPVLSGYIGAFGTLDIDFNPPLAFSTGISIAFSASTTPFTKTDSATAMITGWAV